MAAHPPTRIDPDSGIPDLIRRLTEDSKRLASGEVRLAKLELHDSMRTSVRGVIWVSLALATGVVAAVALTVLLIAAVSAVVGDNYWAGALIVGAVEALAGWLFIRRGIAAAKEPSLTFEVSRAALKDTASWARHPVRH